MAAPHPAAPSEAGFVLVAVIWLLALLGGLVAAMSLYATSALSTLDAYRDAPRAEAALRAGLNAAAARVIATDVPRPGQDAMRLGDGTRVSFTWADETARIDINLAPSELLAGLFVRLGASSDAAAGYAQLIVSLRGMPAEQQRAVAGHPPGYDPDEETPAGILAAAHRLDPKPDPHRPFVDVAQLEQLPGLPPALMARAAAFLTTTSGLAGIDARLAAPEVLDAVPDITQERLRTLLELRDRDPDPVSLDDALGSARVYATTKPAASTRIKVSAALPDGFKAAAEIVIVHFPEDPHAFRIVSWDDEDAMRSGPSTGHAP